MSEKKNSYVEKAKHYLDLDGRESKAAVYAMLAIERQLSVIAKSLEKSDATTPALSGMGPQGEVQIGPARPR